MARIRIPRVPGTGRGIRRLRRARGFPPNFTWDVEDSPVSNLKTSTDPMFLGVSSMTDLLVSDTIRQRTLANQHTLHRDITILCPRARWVEWVETHFTTGQILEMNDSRGWVMVNADTKDFLTYVASVNSVTVNMYGDASFVKTVSKLLKDNFEVVASHVEWVYTNDGASVNVPLSYNNLPVEEMYPFLEGESLESYYRRYMNSSSNILLLIGPPGTGKTTFIRGLLSTTGTSALVTYDTNILDKDYVFAQFIEGDTSVMVLEDSDMFLKSRSDGNSMMHRFLNVGDGLVTMKNKKLIFSTNLPSIRDIDPALTRPGRCFDIVTFGKLSQDEAETLADKVGIVLPETRNDWTVAEVFNQEQPNATPTKSHIRSVGFVR